MWLVTKCAAAQAISRGPASAPSQDTEQNNGPGTSEGLHAEPTRPATSSPRALLTLAPGKQQGLLVSRGLVLTTALTTHAWNTGLKALL